MRKIFYSVALLSGLLLIGSSSPAQDFSFVFYNVENLFDLEDDSLTRDDEFTPEGDKHWNSDRYHTKIDHVARVLVGIGKWELPAIVGLCEIENRKVLYELTAHRLLKQANYKIIHKDSPDGRGIDVGLIYRNDVFHPLRSRWIDIVFESDTNLTTRDILYVKGIVRQQDTIHIFINHWPSRWGGVEATEPKRVEVARRLKEVSDSIFLAEVNPNIIIAGDLNDTPGDSSIYKVLEAKERFSDEDAGLVNLMYAIHEKEGQGTLKYREQWEVYDQIIVSAGIKKLKHSGLLMDGAYIFREDYLLTEDERYLGEKPFRTYSGPRYLGGFSDHLPVYVRFKQ